MSATNGTNGTKKVDPTQSGTRKLPGAVGGVPKPPVFENKYQERAYLKFRLAQAIRTFGNLGFDEGLAGHITVRDPIRPDCFWVNPLGIHFKLIHASDLILVSHDGKVLTEECPSAPTYLLNTAAFMIHSAIHTARPDVMCAAHSHSMYGKAFSTLGKELSIITQDACAFYKDHAVYSQFRGVVLDKEEGEHIVQALQNKKAVILQNHGILVATDSIESTIHFYIALERACQAQLLADAAGKPILIPDEEAGVTYKTVGNSGIGWFSGRQQFMLLEAEEGLRFDFEKEYGPENA